MTQPQGASVARTETAPQPVASPQTGHDALRTGHRAPEPAPAQMGIGRVVVAVVALLVPGVVAVALARYGAPEIAGWFAAIGFAVAGGVAAYLGRR